MAKGFTVSIVDKAEEWVRIGKQVQLMKGSFVKVGVLEDAGSHADGKGRGEGSAIDMARLASIHEFGWPPSNIPERPFLQQSFDTNVVEIDRFKASEVGSIYEGKSDTKKALDRLGVFFVGKVKETFTKGEFAPNSPETIRRKGSSTPLIDTGRLRNSINHEVELK